MKILSLPKEKNRQTTFVQKSRVAVNSVRASQRDAGAESSNDSCLLEINKRQTVAKRKSISSRLIETTLFSIFEQPKITKMARYNSAYTFRHPASRQDNHPWTGERDMDFRQPPFRNEKPMGNNFNYPPRNPASDYGIGYQHSRPVEYMSRSMHVRPNLRPDEHLPRNMHARRQEEYEDELAELNFLRKTELAELNFLRNNRPNITRWDKLDRDEEYQDPRPVAYRLGSIESKEAPICKFFSRTGKCRRFHSECKYLFLFTLTIVCQPLCFYR